MKADIKLPSHVEAICKNLTTAGFEVAVVGGAVRDLLRGETVTDWDLTTSATPAEIQKVFKNSFYNNSFGTVGIKTGENIVEVTTYRTDKSYSDNRHPDEVVWGKSLEEDLKRRDFTVNAMALAYQVSGTRYQVELVDPLGGQEDLKNKQIRTVGNPDQRFGEDALRLIRAIRFATTLSFDLEDETKKSLAKNCKLIRKISGERVREELFKIVNSKEPDRGFLIAHETGILAEILPELDVCFEVPQKSPKRHHIYDVGMHCVMSLKYCPSGDTITRLATLLHDIGKAKVAKTIDGVRTFYNHEVVGGRQVKNIADRLHLSHEQKEKLYRLVRWHQFSVSEDQTDSAIRRFIKHVGLECVEDMMDLRVGDRLGGGLQQPESWRLKLFRQRIKEVLKKPFTVADLKVNGNDVMKILEIKPGPKIGDVLNKLFEEVTGDSKLNNREHLIAQLEKLKDQVTS
ncbi:CCA tRNA nucleotidyltransferase [Candidatus Curtissbacteria bacterium]|nr:CCA tRNA nucleotidyltransferase [Candidatus Curtissbacteria bacterium]